jgi:hypothetical protein
MTDRDRERELAVLMRELDGRASPGLLRSSLERAYDAGVAATAFDLGKQTGPAIAELVQGVEQLVATNGEVARLRCSRGRLHKRVAELEDLIHWMAQTVHQAHHGEGEDAGKTWQECQRGFCSSVRRGLGAGAAHDAERMTVTEEVDGA